MVCGCTTSNRSMPSYQPSTVSSITYRAPGCTPPAASSTRSSGAPVHWAIADQPCSQTWAVICVRAGSPRMSSSESDTGRPTRPLTGRRQSRNPSRKWA